MTLSRKHGFHRRRSNFDRKCVVFKGYGAKKYIKEFPYQGWGTEQTFEKAARKTGTTARGSVSVLPQTAQTTLTLSCCSIL